MNEDDDSNSMSGRSDDLSLKLAEKKQAQMKASKLKEPNLDRVEVDNDTGKITVEAVNISELQIKYYQIDAEVLFSRAPFLKNNA